MAKFGADPNPALLPAGAPDIIDNLTSNVAGFLSTKPLVRYLTGARAIIKVNGRLMGFAFGVSYRINTEQDELMGIDNYSPMELGPKRITIDGTLNMLHIPGKGASNLLVQSNVLSFMFHKYITIEIRDRQTDALIFKTNQAVITSRQEEIRAEQISTVTLNFKAIGWEDEKQPHIPSDAFNGANDGDGGLLSDVSDFLSSTFGTS